jgi:superoxide dismutase, Fe-Mn family
MQRRQVLQLGAGLLAFLGLPDVRAQTASTTPLKLKGYTSDLGAYPFQLPPLGYAFNALEAAIDAQTMELHHDKHHGTQVTNLNNALKDAAALQKLELAELAANWQSLPENVRTAVRNNAGGHINHSLFWMWMKPGGATAPVGESGALIGKTYANLEALQKEFNAAATTRFGSGWAWLCVDRAGALKIVSTPNQDTPLTDGLAPILGLDVWEHAYYLRYQNRRADYIAAFWKVVNWSAVESSFQKAKTLF